MAKKSAAKKKLVIVESPAKAKTINKYLGKNYAVEASVGHVKDLASHRLGIDIENGFKPNYVVIRGKKKIINQLKKEAKNSEEVIIATDPDREGEAIAWHIAEEIKDVNPKIKRAVFNEITKQGVKKGIEEPREIDEKLFMSQQARRVLDRLIGFKVSPFLSRALIFKTSKALSAGRVQSVALRLICEREEHIQNFVPIDYWNVFGEFVCGENCPAPVKARLRSIDGKILKNPEGSAKGNSEEEQKKIDETLSKLFYIASEKEAAEILERVKNQEYSVTKISRKDVLRKPPAPFTTSSLQQDAARKLGFSNKKTMSLAQILYEGVSLGKEGQIGLITYMRTDSTRLSSESQAAARKYIQAKFGKEYVPKNIPVYSTKSKNAQDAHEAIRPTNVEITPDYAAKFATRELAELYRLIYNRFLASQMAPAVFAQTTVDISGGGLVFRAAGSTKKFDGYLAVYAAENEGLKNGEEPTEIPADLKEGEKAELKDAKSVNSKTKPLPRYNAASLVKELDEKGIGRPSTYAAIIGTLQDRGYVATEKKAFVPTDLGKEANESLVKNFPELFNVEFTAKMEDNLDLVAAGEKTYLEVLEEFYPPFENSLEKAEKNGDIPEIKCEKCGAPMVIRVSRRGRFLGCSRYPECDYTRPLPKNEEKKKAPEIAEGVGCPKCGSPMVVREGKYGKFYGCSRYPECDGILPFSTGVKCPKCGQGEIVEKFSPRSKKKFYGCSRYPDCDFITKYEPIAKSCPNCGNYYLEYRYKKSGGEWVKYVKCPKCGETFSEEDLQE